MEITTIYRISLDKAELLEIMTKEFHRQGVNEATIKNVRLEAVKAPAGKGIMSHTRTDEEIYIEAKVVVDT